MPISVVCPKCGSKNRFPDHLEGKNGRCKECGARVPVEQSAFSMNSSSNAGLLMGAVGGFVVFFVVVGLFSVLKSPARQENAAIVQAEPVAGNTSAPSEIPVGGSLPVNPPAVPIAAANPLESNSQPAPSDLPTGTPTAGVAPAPPLTSPPRSQGNSGFQSSSGGFAEGNASALTFVKTEDWTLQPDPGSTKVDLEPGRNLRIAVGNDAKRGSGVLFPSGPSPFVAILAGATLKHRYEIYDVVSGRKIGETPASSSSGVAALSDDGAYLVVQSSGLKTLEVFDIRGKKSLGLLQIAEADKPFQVSDLAIWKHRLVALSNVHKGIKVWELPSGNLVHTLMGDDKFSSSYGYSFSPGGRYLAVDGQFLEKRIDFYDLEAGIKKGSISPAGTTRVSELEALGFSREGTHFAAIYGIDLFGSPARKYSRMVVWDVVTGNVTADFEMEPRLKEQLDPVYQSHTLEGLPGGTRWLVHSLGIVDTEAKALIYSFPKQPQIDLVPSRRVMGAGWVVSVMNDSGGLRMEQSTFSGDDLLAGAATANAGGLASDASLPVLTSIDLSLARTVTPANQWLARADPLESVPLKNAIPVSSAGTVRDIVLSRSPTPVVVVRAGIDEDLNDPAVKNYETTLQIYAARGLTLEKPQPVARESELLAFSADGALVAKLRIPFSARLRSVSPNGKQALVEEHRTNGRLDLYALEHDGAHQKGWRPYRQESDKNAREISQAEFLQDDLIATLSQGNRLVVWKLPNLEALWQIEGVLSFAVSPGGQQLAVVQGNILGAKGLALFASATGDPLGNIPLEGKIQAPTFHPQGDLLAVGVEDSANHVLRMLSMATGEVVEEFPVPVAIHAILWTSPEHLLLNQEKLVHRPLQSVVWSYNTNNVLLPGHLTREQVTFAHFAGNRATIRSLELPNASLNDKLAHNRIADLSLLQPGDSVRLTVQFDSAAETQPLQNSARDALVKQLEAVKTQVADNAPITLNVALATENKEGVKLTKIGDRSVSEDVTRKVINIHFTYTQQGKVIWESRRLVGNLDRSLIRLKQGQSAQAGIDEQMVENARLTLAGMKFPSYIFKTEASQGLGTSPLFP